MAEEAVPDAPADNGSGTRTPDPEPTPKPSDTMNSGPSGTDAAQLDDDAHQFQQHAQTINNVFASRSDGNPRRVTGTIRPAEIQLALTVSTLRARAWRPNTWRSCPVRTVSASELVRWRSCESGWGRRSLSSACHRRTHWPA
jgi:hypothetical protein